MATQAELKAQAKYDRDHTRQVLLKLNKTSDADILLKLDSVDNRQGYLKELVRNDMKKKDSILSLDSLKFLVVPTAKKYEIKRIHLFGSYARGEATPESDVDLLIEGGNYHGLFQYAEFLERLETAIGKKVDVVTMEQIRENKKESGIRFYNNLMRDQVLLYEVD